MMAVLLLGVVFLTSRALSEAGCSDYGCQCHPDDRCHPAYAEDNPCHTSDPNGCYGPVIGTLFSVMFNRSIAQSILPDGLELMKVPGIAEDLWPVQFFFNQQHNVATWNYLEFILLTSNIQWNDTEAPNYDYRGPFGYGAKLFLDELGPTVAGQVYGVNKEVANITQNCDTSGNCEYIIYSKSSGNKIMSAKWSPVSDYVNATQNTNFWTFQQPAFRLPDINQFPVNEGVFQCGYTNWFMDNALIQPVTGEMIIYESFYGNIPTGTYKIDNSIDTNIFGGYRLETMWMFDQPASPTKETCTQFQPH